MIDSLPQRVYGSRSPIGWECIPRGAMEVYFSLKRDLDRLSRNALESRILLSEGVFSPARPASMYFFLQKPHPEKPSSLPWTRLWVNCTYESICIVLFILRWTLREVRTCQKFFVLLGRILFSTALQRLIRFPVSRLPAAAVWTCDCETRQNGSIDHNNFCGFHDGAT
jgi:hypothetical protein